MATANVAATANGNSSAVRGIQAALDLFAGRLRKESVASGIRRLEDAAVSVDPRIDYDLREYPSSVDTTSSVEMNEAVLIFTRVPVPVCSNPCAEARSATRRRDEGTVGYCIQQLPSDLPADRSIPSIFGKT